MPTERIDSVAVNGIFPSPPPQLRANKVTIHTVKQATTFLLPKHMFWAKHRKTTKVTWKLAERFTLTSAEFGSPFHMELQETTTQYMQNLKADNYSFFLPPLSRFKEEKWIIEYISTPNQITTKKSVKVPQMWIRSYAKQPWKMLPWCAAPSAYWKRQKEAGCTQKEAGRQTGCHSQPGTDRSHRARAR